MDAISSDVIQEPFTKIVPPDGFLAKAKFYTSKYGLIHALFSYVGRYFPEVWYRIGRRVTAPYLRQWLKMNQSCLVVNLGGGGNCMTGCLTADIDARADVFLDITKKLPFKSESIDYIFSEEVIEHIDLQSGESLLRECHRVLKPKGILRLTTPDLNFFAKRCESTDQLGKEINDIFYLHRHRHLYTRPALESVLRKIGFKQLYWSTYRDTHSFLGKMDSHADRFNHNWEISQFIEATKE